ncbi:MAG TPA: tRNA pseudouridine(55) synthase TruB [Bryobacteraceae bacterium]|nr:tRNA pseudouridine(55) synthase TruB [Bryobacteraceae bacterium]
MDGVIVVDKPAGWTSHDVVNRMRRLANTRKVGHLGTLDPIATGVLPLVVGRATRLAQFFERNDKVYEASIRFGCATTTYDSEGEPTGECVEVRLTRDLVEPMLAEFRGPIQQVPPPISAKKIGGQPAYKLARRNIEVELKPVQVEIYSFDLLDVAGAEARVRVHCSAGTYLRGIAHDLGKMLGTGAFLKALRRTASGSFEISRALTLERLEELARDMDLAQALIPAAELLPEFPAETVDPPTANFIRQGRDFRVSPFRSAASSRYVKAIGEDGKLIAIAEARLPNLYHPVLVL